MLGLIEKNESQSTESEHERCSETFHDVLTIDAPSHERYRFLMTILIGDTTWKKQKN
jgi:hypothetical protein